MSIVIVSNSRAEHGPLTSVIAALPEAQVLEFVAEGAPHAEMSAALHWFTKHLAGAKLVVVLGDRYETLAAALAATFLRIPIAHIHGGERTTGAFDDALRHSITHLTEQSGGLHFVATESAQTRVMELCGWSPATQYARVRLVGAPGLDDIERGSARRDRKLVVVSYHPETMKPDRGVGLCKEMLAALHITDTEERMYEPHTGHRFIFTGVNKDPGHEQITALIDEFCAAHPSTRVVSPLPREAYIRLLQEAALCVGNSSSFVIEAPWVGVPSVIVGDRQLGREMAASVFQDDADIHGAMVRADHYTGECMPVYRGGGVGVKIAAAIREFLSARV